MTWHSQREVRSGSRIFCDYNNYSKHRARHTGTKFKLSEVTLGVTPATISPFVISKIGENAASRYFLTAEIFDVEEALRLGLLNGIEEDADALDSRERDLKSAFGKCSPQALEACKSLIRNVANRPVDDTLREFTAERLADARESEDGKEGMSAFLEKRKPNWFI